jgi:hypothetical protein
LKSNRQIEAEVRGIDPTEINMNDETSAVPQLVLLVARQPIVRNRARQDWEDCHLLLEMHGQGLVSDRDFLSTQAELELLTTWAGSVHAELSKAGRASIPSKERHSVMDKAAVDYCEWKLHVLVNPSLVENLLCNFHRSVLLVQGDLHMFRIFYSFLRMIQLSKLSETADHLDGLMPEDY